MGTISLDTRARRLINRTLDMWENGKLKWTSGTWGKAVASDGYEYDFEDRDYFRPSWYQDIEAEREIQSDDDEYWPNYEYYNPFTKGDTVGEACAIGSLIVANGMKDDEVVQRAVLLLAEEIETSPKWNELIEDSMGDWSDEQDVIINLNGHKTTTYRRIRDLFRRATRS